MTAEPVPSAAAEIAAYYDAHADEYDRHYDAPSYHRENNHVRRLARIPNRGHMLDIGCGTGLALDLFSPDEYTGIDLSERMIEVARAKYPAHTFLTGNIEVMDPAPHAFDSIVALFGTWSYMLNPQRTFTRLLRLLKHRPGSVVFLMAYSMGREHRPAIRGPIKKHYDTGDWWRLVQFAVADFVEAETELSVGEVFGATASYMRLEL